MSRIEKILQAMIDETSYDKAPQSRIEAILLAIKNNTQYSHLPHSRIEEILLAIKNNTSYDKEPMSRIEEILLAKLNLVEYKKPVQSKIEKLLLKWLYQDLYLTLKGVPPLTFTTNGQLLVDWTIYGNTVNGENVGDLITEGEHAGEYQVPVTVTNGTNTETTNIYLPKPLKTVGDEAEYIDYGEQKQHRVRKNLANNRHTSSSVNYTITENDNYIHVVGTNTTSSTQAIVLSYSVDLEAGKYDLVNNSSEIIKADYYDENGIAQQFNVSSNSIKTFTYPSNVKRALNVYSAIAAGRSIDAYFQVMIVKHGNDTTIYEPYIKNTEVDVTLPAISTLAGTNTLSVGTQVQPSNMEIIYAPKEPELKLMMKKKLR